MPDDAPHVIAAAPGRVRPPTHAATPAAPAAPTPAARSAHEGDPGRVAALFEAGMAGDVNAWDGAVSLWYGTRLEEDERSRFLTVGGPPPMALERALARLRTHVRPPGHLDRFRAVADRYRAAMDGDDDALRWVEAAVGHPSGSLGRSALLGPDGLPVRLSDLGAGLEPGRLDDGWLTDASGVDLSQVCRAPAEPDPVWVQLHVAMGRSTHP